MTTISVSDLEPEKARRYERTFHRILASEKAVETFAQIIDGLPTKTISMECGGDYLRSDILERSNPCARSVLEVRQLQEKLRIGTMHVRTEAAQAYQNAQTESQEFVLRLLGLVAVSLHDLAVGMFREFHPPGGPHHPSKRAYPDGTFTPDLFHSNYSYWQQYPQGPAEMVEYWAEAQIFGGTVLFDHGESDLKLRSAFIHPPALYLFQLSIAQLSWFASLSEAENATSLDIPIGDILPFAPEPGAHEVNDDIETYPNIYRDKYERKPKIRSYSSCVTQGDVRPDMQKWVDERFGRS